MRELWLQRCFRERVILGDSNCFSEFLEANKSPGIDLFKYLVLIKVLRFKCCLASGIDGAEQACREAEEGLHHVK